MSDKVKNNHVLNEKQKTAIEAILSGMNNAQVARVIKVVPETVSRWKALPEFQDELQARRSAMWQGLQDRRKDMIIRAFDVLSEDMYDNEDKRLRQSACGMVLKMAGVPVESDPDPDPEPESTFGHIPAERQAEFMNAFNQLRRDFEEFDL